MFEGGLSELRGDLRCGIVHKIAVLSKDVSTCGAPLRLLRRLLLIWAAVVAL